MNINDLVASAKETCLSLAKKHTSPSYDNFNTCFKA